MTDAEKIRKQTNGRQTEKVEIPSLLLFGQSYSTSGWKILFSFTTTVEPRYNEHLYKEVLGITNDLFCPSNSKINYMKKDLCHSLGPSLNRGSTV